MPLTDGYAVLGQIHPAPRLVVLRAWSATPNRKDMATLYASLPPIVGQLTGIIK